MYPIENMSLAHSERNLVTVTGICDKSLMYVRAKVMFELKLKCQLAPATQASVKFQTTTRKDFIQNAFDNAV